MGFDLSGNKPKINIPIEEFENYHAIESLHWKDKWNMLDSLTDEERSKYYTEMDKYQDANPGIYFRNNVWWWRPLWAYVCYICDEIMTDDDVGGGSYNDGHKISATKAKKMSKMLEESVKSGEAGKYADEIKRQNEELSESTNKDDKFMSNYPFDVDNVERFIKFTKQSGGFVIC